MYLHKMNGMLNNITLSNNGLNLQGSAQTLVIDVDFAQVGLVYRSTSYGWTVY
jgi:hypothetical protein